MVNASRRAVEEDAEGVARVHVAAWHIAYERLLPSDVRAAQTVEKRTEAWKRQLQDPTVAVWVVTSEDLVIEGFVAAGPSRDGDASPRTGEVYAIYVRPDKWRVGVGYSLLQVAERALGADYEVATLWVLDGNGRACRFYERQGWTPDGGWREEARGATVLQEVRYSKKLATHA